jgi:DNA-binding response OmpR family regulator
MLKRVIVVDDDKEIQEIVTFVLNRNGFEVAVPSNGQQLQRLLVTQVPDLINLDVIMPVTKPFHPLDLVEKIRTLLRVTT